MTRISSLLATGWFITATFSPAARSILFAVACQSSPTFQKEPRTSGNNPPDSLAALWAEFDSGFGDRLLVFELAAAFTFICVDGHTALLMVTDVCACSKAPVKISVHDPLGLLIRSPHNHSDVVLGKKTLCPGTHSTGDNYICSHLVQPARQGSRLVIGRRENPPVSNGFAIRVYIKESEVFAMTEVGR